MDKNSQKWDRSETTLDYIIHGWHVSYEQHPKIMIVPP